MAENKHQFYFAVTIVAILAASGFIMLEIADTMTDLSLVEASLFNVVRNKEARLSAEINRGIQDISVDVLDAGFYQIDQDINNNL